MADKSTPHTIIGTVAFLMRRTPMLRVVLALSTGILLAEYLPPVSVRALAIATTVFALLLAATLLPKPRWTKALFLPMLWLALIALGWLTGIARATDPALGLPADRWGTQGNRPVTVVATLTDTPRQAPRTYKVAAHVDALRTDTAWLATDCRMMLYLPQDSTSAHLRYGDRLLLHIRPQLPNDAKNPYQFNYRRHLLHKGIQRLHLSHIILHHDLLVQHLRAKHFLITDSEQSQVVTLFCTTTERLHFLFHPLHQLLTLFSCLLTPVS